MCLDKLLAIFKPKPVPPVVPPEPEPPPVVSLTLPHPEEPKNPFATMENTDIKAVIERWLQEWEVPTGSYPFWRDGVKIRLSLDYPNAEDTFAESKEVFVKPPWANPGVLAHAVGGHISFSLLTYEQKQFFSIKYQSLCLTDPLLKLMLSEKPYARQEFGKNLDVEGHAETYRYIGQFMPKSLEQFYPKLFLRRS